MAVSSHDSKSGVTGSPIHSPNRSIRVYAPGAGESQDTSGGSAVIGLACRIQSLPSPSIAHSMSCGVPRASAMRRASSATAQRLPAIDGVLGLAAGVGAIVPDDPLVTDGRPGHQPIAQAAHGGDDAGAPVPVDRIGGEGHPGRGRRDHLLDDHRHAAVDRRARTRRRVPSRGWQGIDRWPRRGHRRRRPAPIRTCPHTTGPRHPRRLRSNGPRRARSQGPRRRPTAAIGARPPSWRRRRPSGPHHPER